MISTYIFLSEVVEKVFLDFAYRLETEVSKAWLKNNMSMKKMDAYIFDSDLSELWSLIKRTTDTKSSSKAILRKAVPERRDKEFTHNQLEERVHSSLLLISQVPILSFVVNPLNTSQLAYISTGFINEIDTSISKMYYSSNLNPKVMGSHENIIASYPSSANNSPPRKSHYWKAISL